MTYFLPAHAYVPGQNARHAEDAFEAIRKTAKPGMTADALADCAAFKHGLHYLEQGYFWEAHEVLEPVWMVLPEGEDRRFAQGLIQLANAKLKARMERPKAALRLCSMARDLMAGAGDSVMGASRASYLHQVEQTEKATSSAI